MSLSCGNPVEANAR